MDSGYVIILNQQTVIQVIIQLINTAILCFILSKLLYQPVLKFLNARKEKISSQIDKTEADMAQAQALKKEYEEKLKNIESERTAILQEARTTALKNSQIIISDAKTEATAIKDRANLEIERAEEKAKDDIKKQIVQVSTLMSEKFVAAKMTEDEQNKLVDETISDLEEIEWIGYFQTDMQKHFSV